MTNIPQAYKYRYNGVIYIGGALPEGAELLETINRIDEKTAQTIETMDIVDPKADESDLDGKANIDLSNCTKPYIVETYVNGTSWYRVYSDGWCEQGGISGTESTTRGQTINIVFVKNFINTNYTVIAIDGNTSKSTYSTSVGITSVLNGTKTVSGVSISSYGFASSDVHGVINWKTCGYIS